jgi:hypothetical protein
VKIPFIGPSYEARSLNANAQRAVNCYLEMDNKSPRAPAALHGTPGLILRQTLASGPIRGAITRNEVAYFVAGSDVYRVNSNYGAVLLGSIGTTTGPVSMAHNGTQVCIVDGVSGWLAVGATLTEIADVDFPDGVTRVTAVDGYFIATGMPNSEAFYINETPRSGRVWNGLDFASAEGSPDYTITCVGANRELWLFGEESVEVWVNTGNPDFPFERSSSAFIEKGCGAAGSAVAMDNSVFWLGSDKIVYRAQGYSAARVSTHAIEHALQGYTDLSDAVGMTYQIEGHTFYVLSFPTADHTWVFDAATGEWHEWLWRNPDTNTLHRHRASCLISFNGEVLAGDWETGEIYGLDLGAYTDASDPIQRIRSSQTLNDEGIRLFFASLQVDMETGVGLATGQGSAPLVMLRYSNDGGHTWSNERTATVGAAGEYGARAMFKRLGSGRERVWELSMTDPVKFAVFGAFAQVTKGEA